MRRVGSTTTAKLSANDAEVSELLLYHISYTFFSDGLWTQRAANTLSLELKPKNGPNHRGTLESSLAFRVVWRRDSRGTLLTILKVDSGGRLEIFVHTDIFKEKKFDLSHSG